MPQPLAIVTGASSGIGHAVATLLASRRYRTILIARRAERLRQLASELASHAPSVAVPLDLSDTDAVGPVAAALVAEHGPVDVLVNNAGRGLLKPFLDQSPEELDWMMRVHYFAAAALIRAVLPGMLERRQGHVINIGSIATKIGPWGHAAYTAAKSALVSLTQTLAVEYSRDGVHFSYVNPGVIRTEFFDEPSYASMASKVSRHGLSAEAAARRIVSLLDRPRPELVIPRYYRVIDWLNVLCPPLVRHVIARQSRPR